MRLNDAADLRAGLKPVKRVILNQPTPTSFPWNSERRGLLYTLSDQSRDPDRILNGFVTCSASSQREIYSPDNTVRRNQVPAHTDNVAGSWIEWRFVVPISITGFSYQQRTDHTSQHIKHVQLQGSSFYNVLAESDAVVRRGAWTDITGLSGTFDRLRLRQYGLNNSGINYFALGNVEIFGTIPVANDASFTSWVNPPNDHNNCRGVVWSLNRNELATNPDPQHVTSTQSSVFSSSSTAKYALVPSGEFHTDNSGGANPTWGRWDFNVPFKLTGFSFRQRSTVANQPINIKVQSSDDGTTWHDVWVGAMSRGVNVWTNELHITKQPSRSKYRILLDGQNSNGFYYLVLNWIEFYADVT